MQKAWSANTKDRQTGLYLGFDYLALDQPFQAIDVLQQTAKYHPNDAEVLYHLGEAHLEAAQLGVVRLNRLGDQSALSFWALAIAARQKKESVLMLEDLMKALALDPGPGRQTPANDPRMLRIYRGGGLLSLSGLVFGLPAVQVEVNTSTGLGRRVKS